MVLILLTLKQYYKENTRVQQIIVTTLDEERGERTLGRVMFKLIRWTQLGMQESTMALADIIKEY